MIGICGYGYTGSGALLDLLKEFGNTSVCDEIEFDFTYLPDGIEDLFYHLCENPARYLSGNTAIKRYKKLIKALSSPRSAYMKATDNRFYVESNEYIQSLIQVEWLGLDFCEMINDSEIKKTFKYRFLGRISNILELILKKKISIGTHSVMYLSVKPEKFIESSKNYLNKLMDAMKANRNKVIVLNQPYPSNNPQRYFKYFDDAYAIVVDKDPRDMYILVKEVLMSKGSFIPTDDVNDFITYYRKIHEDIGNTDRIIKINFEDLVYRYDEVVGWIKERFPLGEHINSKAFFNPEVSINNTQLYKRYKNYEKDIKVIESELAEYLYPFENYGEVIYTQKAF